MIPVDPRGGSWLRQDARLMRVPTRRRPSRRGRCREGLASNAARPYAWAGYRRDYARDLCIPAWQSGFLWDDDLLVHESPLVRSWSGLADFWLGRGTADYLPLTLSSFWLEWRIWNLVRAAAAGADVGCWIPLHQHSPSRARRNPPLARAEAAAHSRRMDRRASLCHSPGRCLVGDVGL